MAEVYKRYFYIVIVTAVLFVPFYLLRTNWEPIMHPINKSFGDLSFLLLALIIVLPFIKKLESLLKWRRQLGVIAFLLTLGHVFVVFGWWAEWGLFELFGYKKIMGKVFLTDSGFAFANFIGLVAFLIFFVMFITSNDKSQVILKDSWKSLQGSLVMPLLYLSAIHAFYFLFIFYDVYPRKAPPENDFSLIFVVVIFYVLFVKTKAVFKTK